MTALLIAIVLAGCSPSDCLTDCSPGAGTSQEEDTAAMVFSTDDPEPIWTTDDIAAKLEELVSLGAPNPVDIAYDFQQIMDDGDEFCPGDPYMLSNSPCSAEDGGYYQGIGWLYIADRVDIGGTTVPSTWYHGGDFEILRASGERFAGGGDLKYTTEFTEDEATTSFVIAGTWDDASRDDWLGATFSGVYTGEILRSGDTWSLSVNGGIGVGDLDSQFEDVVWDSGEPCLGAPTGAIEVRDPRGYWYEWDLGDDCDACGPVTFHQDQEIGELCLDLKEWGAGMAYLSSPR